MSSFLVKRHRPDSWMARSLSACTVSIPGFCQTAIRTAGINVDRDDQLVFRRRYNLHVVSRAPSTSAIFITRASASVVEARGSFCLATSFLLVFSRRSPLGLQFLHALLRRRDPRLALAGATFLCRAPDTIAGRRISLDFGSQALYRACAAA